MDFPPRELALTLPPSVLAGSLLLGAVRRWRQTHKPFQFETALPPETLQDEELRIAYAEGWGWLVREGLIVPDQRAGQLFGPSFFVVPSRRARDLDSMEAFEQLARGALLPHHLLDERVRIAAEADLFAGQNDTAALKALRQVEIAVRRASGLPVSCYGVTLMRKAFHAESGALRDPEAEDAEREALPQLFAVPFALYSNPTRHHEVGLSAEKTVEILVIASHLLRVVEERVRALATASPSAPGSLNQS